MDQFADDFNEPAPSRRSRRVGTLLLVILAVLVFEFSSNASVGVAIGCLKFAWDDVVDGLWLLRVDPRKRRGLACFFIYSAVGLIKASLCGFIGGIVIAIAVNTFGLQWGWPQHVAVAQLRGATLVVILGLLATAFFGMTAMLLARSAGAKLWVGPEARWARQHNEWPPYARMPTGPRANRATAPLLVTISGMGCLGTLLIVLIAGATMSALKIRQEDIGKLIAFGLIVLMIAAGVGLLMLNDFIKLRVKASSPQECWPEVNEPFLEYLIANMDDFA